MKEGPLVEFGNRFHAVHRRCLSWVTNGCAGHVTGTFEAPQLADDIVRCVSRQRWANSKLVHSKINVGAPFLLPVDSI